MRIRNEDEGMILIAPGMKGKVTTGSENLLAHAATRAGLPITTAHMQLWSLRMDSGWWWTAGPGLRK